MLPEQVNTHGPHSGCDYTFHFESDEYCPLLIHFAVPSAPFRPETHSILAHAQKYLKHSTYFVYISFTPSKWSEVTPKMLLVDE